MSKYIFIHKYNLNTQNGLFIQQIKTNKVCESFTGLCSYKNINLTLIAGF